MVQALSLYGKEKHFQRKQIIEGKVEREREGEQIREEKCSGERKKGSDKERGGEGEQS